MEKTKKRISLDRLFDAMLPLLAVLLAFVVGAVILWLQGVSPLEAYKAMIVGAFGSKNGLADTLVKATPLLLVGLGIAIAFRGGVINIGAEGQLIVGALLTTYIGLQLGERMNGTLVIVIGLLAGMLMGGIWGAIPGYLKAQLGVNEILSTIMMNQIAIQIGYYLLRGPMIDPAELAAGTNIPHSARLPKAIDMPRFTDLAQSLGLTKTASELDLQGVAKELYGLLVEPTRLHSGFIFAVVMAILVYIFLWRTTIGYRIRAVGLNPHASRYAGINVKRTMVLSMTLSGAFAGLAGAVEILGLHHRMFEPVAVSAGYGFSGIVAALFGKLHPLGIIPSSILFGGLLVGGDKMQRAIQVPQVLIQAILGLVVLFVVSTDYFVRKRQSRRVAVSTPAGDKPDEPTATPASTPRRGERMNENLTVLAIILGIAHSGIRLATPYLYAAIGETFSQRSGVLNLGVEGIMLMGAFFGFYTVFQTNNPWLGLLAAAGIGILMGLLMCVVSITFQAEQGISGIGLFMFGLGISSLLFKTMLGTVEGVEGFSELGFCLTPDFCLANIPVLGDIFFSHSLLTYGAFALVPISWWVLNKTTWGLNIRAVGQNPEAADSLGVSVAAVRYSSVMLGAALAGIGGASLSISLLGIFQENMTNGMGFIAVALVYFGSWRPTGVLVGALLFSTVNALQLWVQVLGLNIPSDVAVMMPYLLTIIALALPFRRSMQPAALTKPFDRGGN